MSRIFSWITLVSLIPVICYGKYVLVGETTYSQANVSCWDNGGELPGVVSSGKDDALIAFLTATDTPSAWLPMTLTPVTWYLPGGNSMAEVNDHGCVQAADIPSLLRHNNSYLSFSDCLDECHLMNYTYAALQSPASDDESGCFCTDIISVRGRQDDTRCAAWCLWFPACGTGTTYRVLSKPLAPQGSCIKVTRDGLWLATECDGFQPTICEIEDDETTTVTSTESIQITVTSPPPVSSTSHTDTGSSDSLISDLIIGLSVGIGGSAIIIIFILLCCNVRRESRDSRQAYEVPTVHHHVTKSGDVTDDDYINLDKTDHEESGYDKIDYVQTDHAQLDHVQTDHAQLDHVQTDHVQTDHAQLDHAPTDDSRDQNSSSERIESIGKF